MRDFMTVGVLLVFVLVAGCSSDSSAQESVTSLAVAEPGATVTASEGTAISVEGDKATADWCQAGSQWDWSSQRIETDGEVSWVVDKLETSGEYAGLCHVVFSASGPEGDISMDYWFDETGKNGYVEMDANGQHIKQEWHTTE